MPFKNCQRITEASTRFHHHFQEGDIHKVYRLELWTRGRENQGGTTVWRGQERFAVRYVVRFRLRPPSHRPAMEARHDMFLFFASPMQEL